nr:pantoate--beta-alanine ligase [Actinomadura rugatobispora]
MSAPPVHALPVLVESRRRLREVREGLRAEGRVVAFVPTMGALHEGHRVLIRHARERADAVIVSIFLNPRQFRPGEDFDRYPRTLDTDLEICRAEGVDVVFAPDRDEMYPHEPWVTVEPGPMADVLEGERRPGHFNGVLLVVLKLFNSVLPDIAMFGEKDAQQLAVIRRMVTDLDVPVAIEAVPTVRDGDGLALSSRNAHLSPAERDSALSLVRALRAGQAESERGPRAVLEAGRRVLEDAAALDPPVKTDYLELVEPHTFESVTAEATGPAVLAVAATVGITRLIDNVHVVLGGAPPAGGPAGDGA